MRMITVLLFTIYLQGCAATYKQPSKEGNAMLEMEQVGMLLYNIHTKGEDCSNAINIPKEARIFLPNPKPLIIKANQEIAISTAALNDTFSSFKKSEVVKPLVYENGITYITNKTIGTKSAIISNRQCALTVSFLPKPNNHYKLRYLADYESCSIAVINVVKRDGKVIEISEPSLKKRRPRVPWAQTGSFCEPL